MDAVLRIQSSEFTDELIEKIKALIRVKENSEITISISERSSKGILREETREEYFARLERAVDDLEKGNVITFNGDSLELFIKHLEEKE
ncbi:hypothetical protein [Dyadobacter sp. BHUBP1]|uniref:hypothetical protein n=1 Tax=Dyadobacter sp. BHUBP1 TaxID=3424178 RepID=UPI003D356C58